jgi:hypothetical protein
MAESGRLAEEVTDCGPVIDLKATPGCQLVKDKADPKVNILSRNNCNNILTSLKEQCCGSGSLVFICFWASRIRIR